MAAVAFAEAKWTKEEREAEAARVRFFGGPFVSVH